MAAAVGRLIIGSQVIEQLQKEGKLDDKTAEKLKIVEEYAKKLIHKAVNRPPQPPPPKPKAKPKAKAKARRAKAKK